MVYTITVGYSEQMIVVVKGREYFIKKHNEKSKTNSMQIALFPTGEKPTPEELILAIRAAVLEKMQQKEQKGKGDAVKDEKLFWHC